VIRHALAADDLFVAEDLRKPPYNADLAGKRSVWRSFVGMPLAVDGEQYGALGFATVKQMVQFGPADRDYIKAAAGLIASAVQQAQRDQRLDTLAFHDPLTGLPNRALLHDRLEQTLLGARRNKRSFAAHYIDIDHFKAINDTHGHHVGDVILVAVASWLKASLRDSDTIARIGGDEFVVLQPEIESQQQAEDLAAKLVAIRGNPFRVGTKNFTITVSVGGAVFPWDALNPEDLLTQADAALYEVKARGRDGYSVGTVR
jgi:diguanylate cyclase (GGDEF)-like protein